MNISLNSLNISKCRDIMLYESCVTAHYIKLLEEYKKLYLPEPKRNWDFDDYNRRVYELSCVDQVEMLIRLNPEMDPQDILCEFAAELEPAYNDFDTPDEVFEILGAFINTLEALSGWLD